MANDLADVCGIQQKYVLNSEIVSFTLVSACQQIGRALRLIRHAQGKDFVNKGFLCILSERYSR